MDEERPESRIDTFEGDAPECLEEFPLGIPVKSNGFASMSDELSSGSSRKHSSLSYHASGKHHHLVESCSDKIFIFDAYESKLTIRRLQYGSHHSNNHSPSDSQTIVVHLKGETIVAGMCFFPYAPGADYYGTIMISTPSGIIFP